jgi:phage terminase large subunit-like protein
VLAGKIPVGELAWLAVLRHYIDLQEAAERGLQFDAGAAWHVIRFIERFFVHIKGPKAGQPILLDPWQKFWTACLYGWRRADTGARRFTRGLELVPRKNGKSTWKAPQGAYLWMMDGERGAEVYALGTTREQAMTVFKPAMDNIKRWARMSPGIRRVVKVHDGLNQERLTLDGTSLFRPLPANDDAMDGLNPSAILFDELHAQKTRGLWDVMESALGARRQPLLSAISTAGYVLDGICTELLTYLTRILRGEIQDDDFFGYCYTVDADDDPYHPATWAKANPGLGSSKQLAYMQAQARKAAHLPSARANFLTKDLNVWVGQGEGWFDMRVWDEGSKPVDLAALRGRPCFGGLDLASTRDLTALALVFPPDDPEDPAGQWHLWVIFWAPRAKVQEQEADDRAPYGRWEAGGWIRVTPGNVTDYEPVRKAIGWARSEFDVKEIGFDPYNAQQLCNDLLDDGAPMVQVPQTTQGVGPGAKKLEMLVYGRQIRHAGNPVLRYCADNTALLMDSNDNFRPDKRRSRPNGRIDGIVATCIALSRAAAVAPPDMADFLANPVIA